ncbi:relaxin receptor 1-like isoform X2 [Xenia sp. Carnegie-2017]|uniref:relaxin receptor 1-like isoform X2 n=1 Tax=Xenia sp. Carnegie-2017 TaxID=2897299 RepID=UPI001F03C33C|nr:relaxin receptor 1-like isoform X2 [Xenia sp. Carnegie-2017]
MISYVRDFFIFFLLSASSKQKCQNNNTDENCTLDILRCTGNITIPQTNYSCVLSNKDFTGCKDLEMKHTYTSQVQICDSGEIDESEKKIQRICGDVFRQKEKCLVTVKALKDLSNNELSLQNCEMFNGLIELENLNLAGNDLKEIPTDCFKSLTNLKHLDLSNNELSLQNCEMFNGLIELENLNLAGNGLKEIPTDCFKSLTDLKHLDLSRNNIAEIPKGCFKTLNKLRNLSFNSKETEVQLRDIFTLRNLKIVEMSCENCCHFLCLNNSMICNCSRDPRKTCRRRLLHKESYRVFVWITVVLIFVGNIFALIMRLLFAELHTVQNLFICNLCLSDMLMGVSLVGIMYKDLATYGEYLLHKCLWPKETTCKVLGAISIISSEVSVFTLIFIAYDRFLYVVHGLHHKKIRYRTALALLLFTWLISAAVGVLSIFLPNYIPQCQGRKLDYQLFRKMCIPVEFKEKNTVFWYYSIAILGVINPAAAVCLIILYMRIFFSFYMTSRDAENRTYDHRVMAKRFAAVVFTDVCCWIPVSTLFYIDHDENHFFKELFMIFVPINSAINPFLYTLSAPTFWNVVKKFFLRIFNKWKQ